LLREGAVTKRYLALVRGLWEHGEVEIDTPLAVSRDGSAARVRPDALGKSALSIFRLVDRYGDLASLVEVEIRTGRTHQIRVHAAESGHPIAGDDRYGDRGFNAACERLGLRRMFLHAQLIELVWPDSGEELIVSTPLPDDLRRFLDGIPRKA
jgi:23S rRNA pseudouridine955/2504/2580 synthase